MESHAHAATAAGYSAPSLHPLSGDGSVSSQSRRPPHHHHHKTLSAALISAEPPHFPGDRSTKEWGTWFFRRQTIKLPEKPVCIHITLNPIAQEQATARRQPHSSYFVYFYFAYIEGRWGKKNNAAQEKTKGRPQSLLLIFFLLEV